MTVESGASLSLSEHIIDMSTLRRAAPPPPRARSTPPATGGPRRAPPPPPKKKTQEPAAEAKVESPAPATPPAQDEQPAPPYVVTESPASVAVVEVAQRKRSLVFSAPVVEQPAAAAVEVAAPVVGVTRKRIGGSVCEVERTPAVVAAPVAQVEVVEATPAPVVTAPVAATLSNTFIALPSPFNDRFHFPTDLPKVPVWKNCPKNYPGGNTHAVIPSLDTLGSSAASPTQASSSEKRTSRSMSAEIKVSTASPVVNKLGSAQLASSPRSMSAEIKDSTASPVVNKRGSAELASSPIAAASSAAAATVVAPAVTTAAPAAAAAATAKPADPTVKRRPPVPAKKPTPPVPPKATGAPKSPQPAAQSALTAPSSSAASSSASAASSQMTMLLSTLDALKHELTDAVTKQQFEKCVPLRDKIKKLEDEIASKTKAAAAADTSTTWDDSTFKSTHAKLDDQMKKALDSMTFELCAGIRDKKKTLDDIKAKYEKASDDSSKRSALADFKALVATL